MKALKAIDLLSIFKINRSIMDYMAVLFGSGTARVIALGNNILIARFLGSEKFGLFSLFYLVMLLAWIIPQSFDTTFIKFAKSEDTAGQLTSYWRVNIQMKLFYCTLMSILALPAGQILAIEFFHKPQTSSVLSLGLICGALLSIMNSVASSFQVKEKFGHFAILQGLYAAIVFTGLLILFFATSIRGVMAVIYLYMAVSTAMGFISLVIILRATPHLFTIEPEVLKRVIHFGKWIFLTAVAFYAFPRIDGIILAKYLDLNKLGLYSVATQFTMVISVVTGSMSAVFLPRAMQALKNNEALKNYLKDATQPITIVLVSIFMLALAAPLLVKFIYGDQYMSAVWPLRILLLGYIFNSLYLPMSFLYYAMELPHIRSFLEIGKMILVLFLFSLFIPTWDMTGAAAAMTVAMTANFLLSGSLLYFLLRRHRCKHNQQ